MAFYSQVEWSPIPPHQDMVYSLPNGSLVFYPFSAEKYRHEIHSTIYRQVSFCVYTIYYIDFAHENMGVFSSFLRSCDFYLSDERDLMRMDLYSAIWRCCYMYFVYSLLLEVMQKLKYLHNLMHFNIRPILNMTNALRLKVKSLLILLKCSSAIRVGGG